MTFLRQRSVPQFVIRQLSDCAARGSCVCSQLPTLHCVEISDCGDRILVRSRSARDWLCCLFFFRSHVTWCEQPCFAVFGTSRFILIYLCTHARWLVVLSCWWHVGAVLVRVRVCVFVRVF